jgi:hypothetical protein
MMEFPGGSFSEPQSHFEWFWCIKGTQSEETHQFDVRIDHGVSA